jgi:hypothetical protein
MGDTNRIIKELVLRCTPFKGLEDNPLKGRFRVNHPLFSLCQLNPLKFAVECADAASEAYVIVDDGLFLLFCLGVLNRHHFYGLDGAGLRSFAAAGAAFLIDLGDEA